jgi:hypothetical protein
MSKLKCQIKSKGQMSNKEMEFHRGEISDPPPVRVHLVKSIS